MRELEHARALLGMAEKDLKALQGMQDADVFADEIFGFHAQQAMEKTLKAWIACHAIRYPLTHDVGALLILLDEHHCYVEPFWDLVEYNVFAVQFRYESLGFTEEPLDRTTVLDKVKVLVDHVNNIIKDKATEV